MMEMGIQTQLEINVPAEPIIECWSSRLYTLSSKYVMKGSENAGCR